ncbi:GumC family protein [Rhodopila sp.]|uniref:GumC family protein n=1 Tax=Rhodopila sp. TaxID=2480087 RepID=UPI003D09EEDA
MNGYAISVAALPAILSRRKWLILLCGLLASALALGVTKVIPDSYVAEGALIIDTPRVGPMGSAGGTEGVTLTQAEILRTQKDVIRSRGLIARVVNSLNLDKAPGLAAGERLPSVLTGFKTAALEGAHYLKDFVDGGSRPDDASNARVDAAIQYVSKHLQLESSEESSVVSLQFTAGTPDLAVSVLNAIMNTYIADLGNAKRQEWTATNRLMLERAAAIKVEADDAKKHLESFLRQHGLPEVQGSLGPALQLSKNQDQLSTAQADLARKQAKLEVLTHFGASSLPEVLDSRTIQRYHDTESEVLGKLALFGPLDPRRRPLNSALLSIRSQIKRETDKFASSIRRDVDIASANVKHLEAAVASESSASQASSVAAVTLASLKSDVEAKQQMYIAFQKSAADQVLRQMSQSPLAHILFPPAHIPRRHLGFPALILGFLAGILLASAAVVLRYMFNSTIGTAMDLAIATGLPVAASLPAIKGRIGNGTISYLPAFAETLRALGVSLHPMARDEAEIVLVTSSEVGEGKTTLATTLAETYAGDGFRVLLIDADLRRPKVSRILGLQPTQTLESVLAGKVHWSEAVVQCPSSGLHCLPANGSSRNPISAINAPHFATLIGESKQRYDYIILDSPPVLRVADPLILARYCRHILLIVRAGFTRADLVSQAMERFTTEDRPKLRALLTRVKPQDLDSGGYYGGYDMPRLEAA